MTSDKVELTRQVYDAWNRDDLEAFQSNLTEDFEMRPLPDFPGLKDVYHGLDGFAEFWAVRRAAWERVEIQVDRIEQHGDDVLALLTFDGVGKGSGVPVSMTVVHRATFRGDLGSSGTILLPEQVPEVADWVRDSEG